MNYFFDWSWWYKKITSKWKIQKMGWCKICSCVFTMKKWGMYQGACWLGEKWAIMYIDNKNTRCCCCFHVIGVGCKPCYLWFGGELPLYCWLMMHSHLWFWKWPHGKNRLEWNLLIRKSHQLHQHRRCISCRHGGGRTGWISWQVGVVDALILLDIQRVGWWWHQKWWGRR